MGSQWPPSPRVEDEELALKNEISHKAEITCKQNADEACCRGTVDQYPIILDVDRKAGALESEYPSSTDNEGDSVRTRSSDDSDGPPTPPYSKAGQKNGQPPLSRSTTPRRFGTDPAPFRDGEKLDDEGAARGRPSIPRIQTDIGGDLKTMATGQRRMPSPYAYTKPESSPHHKMSGSRFSGDSFLSPESLLPGQSFSNAHQIKRHSSARPRSESSSKKDSDDSDEVERRRRHHSRHRSARTSSPRSQSSMDAGPREFRPSATRSSHYIYPQYTKDDTPRRGLATDLLQRVDKTQSQKQRTSDVIAATSQANHTSSRDCTDAGPWSAKRLSKDSPYASSTEDGSTHRRGSKPAGKEQTPSRPAMTKKERPRLDLSGRHHSFHGATAGEGYEGDKYSKPGKPAHESPTFRRKDYTNHASPHPSPGRVSRSPSSNTPPCSVRGDRRSGDYFTQGSTASPSLSDNVRPGASSYSDYGPGKALAGVTAAALGPRAVPLPFRGTVSSAEMHPAHSSAWPANPRRSRNTSPNSAGRESLSRPGLSAGSARYSPPPTASSDSSNARSGSYAPASLARPRLNNRAFSHSAADGSYPAQPNSAKSMPLHSAPPTTINRAPLPNPPRLPRSPSSLEKVPRQVSFAELPPCPRSVAASGYYDWYTVVGMPQLDVCPSCMTVLAASPFRDMFVPSTSTVPGQRILCDFSRPWVRQGWAQIIKQRRGSLEMIYQVVRNTATTRPCPGKGSDIRAWYRLPDPETKSNVPNFDACSECVRSIEIIFPQLRGIFKRSGALVQERTCDLNTQSRRFDGYLRLLDAAALQYDVERLREPDIKPFAVHARRTARVRECTRDDMVLDQVWHFIPGLPQFTVCEECFEQVVWPVIDQPVARMFNRTLQLVPGTNSSTGLSCQVYSERMRKKLLEAVQHGDFDYFKQIALRRHAMERHLQERHKALTYDMSMGINCTAGLQANIEEWRKWE